MPAGALALLAGSSALTAVVVATAVFFAPDEFRIPLAAGASAAALALTAALTAAAYYRSRVNQARHEALGYKVQADAHVAATISTAQSRIAESEARIHALQEQAAEQARAAKENENRRAAAMAAFAGAAGRMQAMSTSMLAELREMEHRHADPKVLADLLELDHRTAQAGRLADSIAVLSGARSGRRWAKPIAMESILRGAMGRVAGYQRVRLRAVTEIAIAGHAAEGIMHALAELLDNACNFSPPTTEVHVYAAEVPAGVVITIEDSGLVMSESALRRAESAVSRDRSAADLSSLSGTRLGLAVVGHLARKHDLTVSYRPSAIGGTAVVVVVPRELTTRLERHTGTLSRITPVNTGSSPIVLPAATEQDRELPTRSGVPAAEIAASSANSSATAIAANPFGEPLPRTAPTPAVSEPSAAPASLDEIAQRAAASGNLPKRRRGSTLAAVHPDGLAAPTTPPAPRPPSSPNSLAAFQRAVNGRGDSGAPEVASLTNLGSTPATPAAPTPPGPMPTAPARYDSTPAATAPSASTPGGSPFPSATQPISHPADNATLLPSSLLDAVRRGEFREKARAANYSTGEHRIVPPGRNPGRDYDTDSRPAPTAPSETDR
ncbi:sensor histidine kinase [Nocardia concava]|uniref:sensor histidine kinase n=1 Tax=Nocardia concava TaxID=257281 RepID=UPI0002DADB2E|nr:ATP-binding protein [Nocardia concava]